MGELSSHIILGDQLLVNGVDHMRQVSLYNNNAPINVKPHLPPPRHRWGFVQLVVQRTHPRSNYFLQCPSLDAFNTLAGTMWRFV